MPSKDIKSGSSLSPSKKSSQSINGQLDQNDSLTPLNPITAITEKGKQTILPSDISVEGVGWKAYGLASLASQWVPSFFLITFTCLVESDSDEILDALIAECLLAINGSTDKLVIVRSSGISETMRYRGQLESTPCSPSDILATIRKLVRNEAALNGESVHWIVQKYIAPKEKGHLSNERRLKMENRDWVVEFESQKENRNYVRAIAVRRWRDGSELTRSILSGLDCISEAALIVRLKSVAKWATTLSSRIHFEWVWDGKRVYIVQAQVEEPDIGIDPKSLLPKEILLIEPNTLKFFRPTTEDAYENYKKLKNAKLYKELGYSMPTFYIADNPVIISSILSGSIQSELKDDLVELTKRSLILRTDGINIPSDKREMLPRSDELRTEEDAIEWLLAKFQPEIVKLGLVKANLCLIAHHFIPSVASAWAHAEPGNRIVRIESLWGIPEGIYWFSHDTFEVDTQNVEVGQSKLLTSLPYTFSKHLRYKGTFVASDVNGKWIPHHAKKPYDWAKSIARNEWLFEIAHTTRRISERENHAVDVMWFIDNHKMATEHKILPWFHSKPEHLLRPKGVPRRKRRSASNVKIKNTGDWEQLQQNLEAGLNIERVVIEPDNADIIRNPTFAKELAELANKKKFVVELYGGILSHAYYILQSCGASVECVDLFGANEDVTEYNKLVRDKIPNHIQNRGERVEVRRLGGEALVTALRQKLVEEAFEALDASPGELVGELADVQEVVRGLCQALGLSVNDIESEREEKAARRGGFNEGLMLIKTSTPHSISKQVPEQLSTSRRLDLKPNESIEHIISEVPDLPTKRFYRRPDLRQVNQQLEKLFTFETETNTLGQIEETLSFSLPINDRENQEFTLTIGLRRAKSVIRGEVRLRLLPTQLLLDFSEDTND
ncbi:MAG TPA: nucleoside triphosphate pyrophosphohydrolase [Blastocatellia bacterium]|nr:nucleoside triphosphate pyrophosphohydrolase [Blastocatellia bacterium]HMZ16670.1 nucleoside triphosphate pyrophosphohydrolase [Blastocatellia bacterium]HNG33879.1 nucleoside triphosphate pyrophosphohydrolase [Blastocatellia bacterium]